MTQLESVKKMQAYLQSKGVEEQLAMDIAVTFFWRIERAVWNARPLVGKPNNESQTQVELSSLCDDMVTTLLERKQENPDEVFPYD
jgi:hypothetical protein